MNRTEINLFDYTFSVVPPYGNEILEHIDSLINHLAKIDIQSYEKFYEVRESFWDKLRLCAATEDDVQLTSLFKDYSLFCILEESWALTSHALILFHLPTEIYQISKGEGEPRVQREDFIGKPNLYAALALLMSAMQALNMYYSVGNPFEDFAKKGGRAASTIFEKARTMSIDMGCDRWQGDDRDLVIPSLNNVSKDIQRALGADLKALGLKKTPALETIKIWIKHIAPPEAKKSGRPKKPPEC